MIEDMIRLILVLLFLKGYLKAFLLISEDIEPIVNFEKAFKKYI